MNNAGAREYWIADPQSEQVLVYIFEEVFDEVRDLPDEESDMQKRMFSTMQKRINRQE